MTIESDIVAVHEERGQCDMPTLWGALPQHKQAIISATVSAMVKKGTLVRPTRTVTNLPSETPPAPQMLPAFQRVVNHLKQHGPTRKATLMGETRATQPVITDLVNGRHIHYTGQPGTEIALGPHPKHNPDKRTNGQRAWNGEPRREGISNHAMEANPVAPPKTVHDGFGNELKACPWCAALAIALDHRAGAMRCANCGATGPAPKERDFSVPAALAWNSRA